MPPPQTTEPSVRTASVVIRAGLPADCDDVAQMARELAKATAPGVLPEVTGEGLRADLFGQSPLLRLIVAEQGGNLAGYCLSLLMFSTWRGTRGLHLIDLYVRPSARRGKIGDRMLAAAAARGWQEGARFIRLEVERGNVDAERFYDRLGFTRKDNEHLYAVYHEPMRRLAARWEQIEGS